MLIGSGRVFSNKPTSGISKLLHNLKCHSLLFLTVLHADVVIGLACGLRVGF